MKARNILIAAAFVALTLLGAGCKKYNFTGSDIRFIASSKAVQTKTVYSGDVIDGYERIDWIVGDKIVVLMENDGGREVGEFRIKSSSPSSSKSIAKLDPLGGPFGGNGLQWGEGAHEFSAYYPAPSVCDTWQNEVSTDKIVLEFPATQVVTEDENNPGVYLPDMKYAYMIAEASTDAPKETINLSFIPIINAFEISISAGDNDEINLSGFRLICHREDIPIAGIYTMAESGDELSDEAWAINVDLTGVKLTRNGGPIKFTVFTFPDEISEVTLEFTGTEIGTRTLDMKKNGEWISFDGCSKHKIYGLNFPRLDEGTAEGQGINWNGTVGEDLNWNSASGEDLAWGRDYVLPGRFSIAASKAVNFSRGNLVYKAGEWTFHPYQYSRCLKTNSTVLDYSQAGTFDLFGWATAGIAPADATMKNFQPWSLNSTEISGQTSTNPYGYGPSIANLPAETDWDVYANYCEWGKNYKLRQSLGDGWYTLSASEYEYMFCDRPASTVNDVPNARFARAVVHGTPGVLVFPDDFGTRYTGDQSIFVAENINDESASGTPFEDITISDPAWTVMEEAGAVFFPATGIYIADRQHWLNDEAYGYDGYVGALWSRTSAPGQGEARAWLFSGREIEFGEGGVSRYYGLAVRLVKNAE